MRSDERLRCSTVLCWLASLALVATLAGCGAFGNKTAAADGKAGGSVAITPVVLRMLNPNGEWDSEDFVSEVQKVSKGALRIEAVDDWHQDAADSETREHNVIDAVRAGEAPLAITAVRAWHDQGIRSFDALIAPLLIDRTEVQTAVLHSQIPTDMLAGLKGSGLTGIGILPGSLRHPGGITRQLVDVADYRGARILLGPGAVGERWLEALGATPEPSLFGNDLDLAADDGFEIQTFSLPLVAPKSFTSNVNFGPRPLVVYGNAVALATLSEQNRTFLLDASRAALNTKANNDHAIELESVGVLCRSGTVSLVQATPAQITGLHSKAEPVYRWLRADEPTAGFMDRIQQLADSTPVDPNNALVCPTAVQTSAAGQNQRAQASAAASVATPVDGTYTVNTTLADLEANGSPPDAWVPENWGDSVYVFAGGRFATTQQNDQACTWAYGRYAVDGDVLTLDYEGGGGKSPNNAFNKPGERFGFGWSLYREVLTLTKKDGMFSPVVDGTEWRFDRVSTKPDRSALSKQCPPPAAAFPK